MYAATVGTQTASYADTLGNIGLVYMNQGKLEQALPLYEESLSIKAATVGRQTSAYANDLFNLGTLKYNMGDIAGAMVDIEESRAIRVAVGTPIPANEERVYRRVKSKLK